MIATNHALTGAFIATTTKRPELMLPAAFVSHFICDAIPHFGINMKFGSLIMYNWLTIDGALLAGSAIVLILMDVNNPAHLAVGGFIAMSPDLFWLFYGLRGDHNKISKYDFISKIHSRIQWYQKVPGAFIEIFWAISMIFGILKLQ